MEDTSVIQGSQSTRKASARSLGGGFLGAAHKAVARSPRPLPAKETVRRPFATAAQHSSFRTDWGSNELARQTVFSLWNHGQRQFWGQFIKQRLGRMAVQHDLGQQRKEINHGVDRR